MTPVALSLAVLCTPSGKYTARRKERIAYAREWATAHNYQFQQEALTENAIHAGPNSALRALATMQHRLQEGQVAPGTVLILDDFIDFSEPAMRQAILLLMTLSQHGLDLVTLRDGKIWDARAMGDLVGFMFSVILAYAPDLDANVAEARRRHTRNKKERLAAEESAK